MWGFIAWGLLSFGFVVAGVLWLIIKTIREEEKEPWI
jgi:hypothetical protein